MESKATKLLEWICRGSVLGENLFIVDIPENNEFESQEEFMIQYFGNSTPFEIPGGKYLYYYRSSEDWATDQKGNYIEMDAEIEIPTNDGFDSIYLYRIG